MQLSVSANFVNVPLNSTRLASFEIPLAAESIMIIFFTLANVAAEFLLDLQRTMDIQMTSLETLSAFESFVHFLFPIK